MTKLRNIAFGLLMLLYIAYPISLIQGYATVAQEGQLYRLRPMPVDPFDHFRGSYVTLSYENRIPYPQANEYFSRDQVVYLQLEVDDTGYAQFTQPTAEQPNTPHYFRTRIQRVTESDLYFKVPDNMQRYFLPAEMAQLAEDAYREMANRNAAPNSIYINMRVLNGEIVIEELYLEELPVLDYLRQQLDNN